MQLETEHYGPFKRGDLGKFLGIDAGEAVKLARGPLGEFTLERRDDGTRRANRLERGGWFVAKLGPAGWYGIVNLGEACRVLLSDLPGAEVGLRVDMRQLTAFLRGEWKAGQVGEVVLEKILDRTGMPAEARASERRAAAEREARRSK